jgi:serine/threonine-protein kinase
MVTGRPPFDGETPSAVMHKHHKQQLVPADHLNTNLSAGIGEIIDLAMAKSREDRYRTTEDMLEDLEAVRLGHPPPHAHQDIPLERIGELEKRDATVDIPPETVQQLQLWNHPVVIGLLAAVGVSLLINVVMLVVLLTRK